MSTTPSSLARIAHETLPRFGRVLGISVLLAGLTMSSLNCGIIFHPERSGRAGGRVDVAALVLDCLWLLVGVVPGVVALVVDFATGGIYEGGGRSAQAGQRIDLQFKGAAPLNANMGFTLVSPDGSTRELGKSSVQMGEAKSEGPLMLPDDLAPGHYALDISVNGRKTATLPLNVR
ncbi:MAG: hypothetical protein HOO96_18675 [Polyangiaceae bacterium]|nr:hypothetical protein [Polyangiaceae bacterium]